MDSNILDKLQLLPFQCVRYRLRLSFRTGGHLKDEAPVSALRDGIGRGLRRLSVCNQRPDCDCPFCTYFELAAKPGHAGGISPGFILELPYIEQRIEPGNHLELDLTLMGKAADAYPWFAAALLHAGHVGIGNGPAQFCADLCAKPEDTTAVNILAKANSLNGHNCCEIHFASPCILVSKGIPVDTIDFQGLIKAIIERLQPNVGYWCSTTIRNKERDELAAELIHKAADVKSSFTTTRWTKQRAKRFGGAENSLSGFTGVMQVSGGLEEFWPLLLAGEIVHIGQRPHLDRGRYRIAI